MVLSTLNNNSINSRTVLLKDISSDGFTFFTNYTSKKGVDIQKIILYLQFFCGKN